MGNCPVAISSGDVEVYTKGSESCDCINIGENENRRRICQLLHIRSWSMLHTGRTADGNERHSGIITHLGHFEVTKRDLNLNVKFTKSNLKSYFLWCTMR